MKTLLKRDFLPIEAMIAFANFATAQTLQIDIVESIGNPPAISLYQYGTRGIYVNVPGAEYTTNLVGYDYTTPTFGGEYPGSIKGGGLCEMDYPYNSVVLPSDTYKLRLYRRGQYGVEWSITLSVVKE